MSPTHKSILDILGHITRQNNRAKAKSVVNVNLRVCLSTYKARAARVVFPMAPAQKARAAMAAMVAAAKVVIPVAPSSLLVPAAAAAAVPVLM